MLPDSLRVVLPADSADAALLLCADEGMAGCAVDGRGEVLALLTDAVALRAVVRAEGEERVYVLDDGGGVRRVAARGGGVGGAEGEGGGAGGRVARVEAVGRGSGALRRGGGREGGAVKDGQQDEEDGEGESTGQVRRGLGGRRHGVGGKPDECQAHVRLPHRAALRYSERRLEQCSASLPHTLLAGTLR